MKYWEIIADNLSKAGWSMGYVSAIDSNGRTIWIADAHCGDGKRFVVHADEKLTAFIKVESGCALAAALLGTRWRKSLVEVMRAKPQPPGRQLSRWVVPLEIVDDGHANLKFLCTATKRLFQCSAKDNRDFWKTLRNACAYPVTPPIVILKIDSRFVLRVHWPSLRKNYRRG